MCVYVDVDVEVCVLDCSVRGRGGRGSYVVRLTGIEGVYGMGLKWRLRRGSTGDRFVLLVDRGWVFFYVQIDLALNLKSEHMALWLFRFGGCVLLLIQ